jgi:hypothetical protein
MRDHHLDHCGGNNHATTNRQSLEATKNVGATGDWSPELSRVRIRTVGGSRTSLKDG